MDKDTFLHYNALDAACTIEAHNRFWEDLSPAYSRAYDLTVSLFPVLTFMMTRGIRVNMEEMQIAKKEILQSQSEKQAELDRLCGRELNVHSPKDCQTYFYVEKGIAPYYSDSGAVTVDDLALQRMARGTAKRPGLREAKLVQEIRGLHKLYATYLDIEFDPDGRIRCAYNPRGTKFGRLSSSSTVFGTGTNLQNLPQEFKRFLVADPGYVFWEVDKRQAEWVVVAYLANDSSMIKVVEDELDAHTYTASMMFVLPEDIIKAEAKAVGMLTEPDKILSIRQSLDIPEELLHRFPRSMSARQAGKKSNHGLNYDEGPNKFALTNEIDQAEGKRIVELYHRVYPGIRQTYHAGVQRQLQADRTLTNCFGRKVRFLDAWGHDLWKAGYSMLPQSTVVDSLNQGMVEIYNTESLVAGPNGIDILAQTHDSILLQVPVSWFTTQVSGEDKTAFDKAYEMVYNAVSPTLEYNGRTFKIATDSKIGLNWGGFNKDSNPRGMQEVKNSKEAVVLARRLSGVGS